MRGTTILLVDDEQHIADVVEYVLREHGFSVVHASDGDAGLRLFRISTPDLVLLDLGLPGIDGIDLFKLIREIRPAVPVIMLTARDEETDKVIGLELGADDYITKPFSPRELAARVRAVLRRSAPGSHQHSDVLTIGPLSLDPEAFAVVYMGQSVNVTHLEFRLLECLMRNPARTYPRASLIDAIYNGEAIVTDRCIDAQVKRLRKKFLAICGDLDPIHTVYGTGYKINPKLDAPEA